MLNAQQLERYSRQIQLSQIGTTGQEKLSKSHALIIGCGGLGSPATMYLAASGIGKLTLVDYDLVELSNLQRQIAHFSHDIGKLKTDSAQETCLALNPEVEINLLSEVLDEEELPKVVAGANVVLDCSDNFPTRFAINTACVQQKIPLVSGAAMRWEAQVAVYRADLENAPCYRCLFRDTEAEGEACAQVGVISPLVGVVGSLQALEAIKVLLEIGQEHSGQLLLYDAISFEWRTLTIPKDPACPLCAQKTEPAKT